MLQQRYYNVYVRRVLPPTPTTNILLLLWLYNMPKMLIRGNSKKLSFITSPGPFIAGVCREIGQDRIEIILDSMSNNI